MVIARKWIALAATCFLLVPNAAAQDQDPQDVVELQFLTFPMTPDALQLRILDEKDKATDILVMSNVYSKSYRVARSKTWRICDAEAGGLPVILGKVDAIEDRKQLLLLVSKGREKDAGFEVFVMPNRIDLMAKGDIQICNLATMGVLALVEGARLELNPTEHTVISPKGVDGNGDWAQITLSYRKDDKWKRFLDSRWLINETVRSFIYLYQDPANGRIQVHTLAEGPPEDL